MTRHTPKLAALRHAVAKIDGTQERLAVDRSKARLPIGVAEIDHLLGGGLALDDMHELRCDLSRDIGCAIGFLICLLQGLQSLQSTQNGQPVFWITDPATLLDTGTVFPAGMAHFDVDASRLLHARPVCLADSLWTAGEAVRTGGLTAVILQVKGNPALLDLSASRKLMLRAQTGSTPLFILRQAGEEEASSAATRWHIKPAPSLPNEIYPKGLGHMRLTLTLEKNRNGQTGQWPIAWNPKTRSFEHAASSSEPRSGPTAPIPQSTHSSLPLYASANRQDRTSALGEIVAREWKERRAS